MLYRFAMVAALVGASATLVFAQDVKKREPTMKEIAGGFGALNKMNRGQSPYDGAAASAAFTRISENAKHFATLFGPNPTPADRSLPSIWENKPDFDARISKLAGDAASGAKDAAKSEAEFKTAFAKIQPQCGSCHEKYRGD